MLNNQWVLQKSIMYLNSFCHSRSNNIIYVSRQMPWAIQNRKNDKHRKSTGTIPNGKKYTKHKERKEQRLVTNLLDILLVLWMPL